MLKRIEITGRVTTGDWGTLAGTLSGMGQSGATLQWGLGVRNAEEA